MKKLLSLLLVLALSLSLILALSSCDEEDAKGNLEELNEEQWAEAVSAPSFENVTVNYEYTVEGLLQKQLVKVTKDGVYRKIEAFNSDGSSVGSQAAYFTGAEGDMQRDLFLQTFLGIVKDRDNFTFDAEEKLYKADDVSIRIDQGTGVYVTENVKNGKLSFDGDGSVKEFVCTLTESMYMNDEQMQSMTIDVIWSFSAYGTTEITAEEQKSASSAPAFGVGG